MPKNPTFEEFCLDSWLNGEGFENPEDNIALDAEPLDRLYVLDCEGNEIRAGVDIKLVGSKSNYNVKRVSEDGLVTACLNGSQGEVFTFTSDEIAISFIRSGYIAKTRIIRIIEDL